MASLGIPKRKKSRELVPWTRATWHCGEVGNNFYNCDPNLSLSLIRDRLPPLASSTSPTIRGRDSVRETFSFFDYALSLFVLLRFCLLLCVFARVQLACRQRTESANEIQRLFTGIQLSVCPQCVALTLRRRDGYGVFSSRSYITLRGSR